MKLLAHLTCQIVSETIIRFLAWPSFVYSLIWDEVQQKKKIEILKKFKILLKTTSR